LPKVVVAVNPLQRPKRLVFEVDHPNRTGLREAGPPIVVDPALIRAFEIEKETHEFIYASTYLPSWLYAPTAGMRSLFDRPG